MPRAFSALTSTFLLVAAPHALHRRPPPAHRQPSRRQTPAPIAAHPSAHNSDKHTRYVAAPWRHRRPPPPHHRLVHASSRPPSSSPLRPSPPKTPSQTTTTTDNEQSRSSWPVRSSPRYVSLRFFLLSSTTAGAPSRFCAPPWGCRASRRDSVGGGLPALTAASRPPASASVSPRVCATAVLTYPCSPFWHRTHPYSSLADCARASPTPPSRPHTISPTPPSPISKRRRRAMPHQRSSPP